MAYDWRGHPLWRRLSPEDKLAAMTLMEADRRSVKDAKNIAHAIFNRSKLHGQDLERHLNEKRSSRSKYGTYQPLYEADQLSRLPSILRSKAFQEMRGYVGKVTKGEVPDPTKGATHYLSHAPVMRELERKNPRKYRDWGPRGSNWTGYSDETGDYKNVTLKDGSHSFIIPPESERLAKRKGIDLAAGWFQTSEPDTLSRLAEGKLDPLPEAPKTAQATEAPKAYLDTPEALQAGFGAPVLKEPEPQPLPPQFHEDINPPDNLPSPSEPLSFEGMPTERNDEYQTASVPGTIIEVGDNAPQSAPAYNTLPDDYQANISTPQSVPTEHDALDDQPGAEVTRNDEPVDLDAVDIPQDSPEYNPDFNPRYRKPQGLPMTEKQIMEERERIFGPEGVEVSWADAFSASWENTWHGESLEAMWRNTDEKYSKPDPNFKIPDNALDGLDEEDHDFVLGWSKNEYALEQNILEAKARQKARKDWQNLSGLQTVIAGGSSFIPTLGIAVAAGAPFAAATTALLPSMGIATSSLVGRAIVGAADGFFGTGAEAAFGTIGGAVRPEDVPFWMMVGGTLGLGGGMVFHGLGKAWNRGVEASGPVINRERAVREASQDGLDAVLEKNGVTVPKTEDLPAVQRGEIATHNEPARLRVDEKDSVLVHRDVNDLNRDAASRLESDAPLINDAFKKTMDPDPRVGQKALDDIAEVFDRQSYILQEKDTIYMAVKKGMADLNNAFRGKVARGFSNLDDAMAHYKPDESIILRISLPKGTRVIRGGELGKDIGEKGDVIFGDGGLHFKRVTRGPNTGQPAKSKITTAKHLEDAAGKLEAEVQPTTFTPAKRNLGKPQFAKATSKETGGRMPDDVLRSGNKDLAENGYDSGVFKFGAAGAMRASPDTYRLIDTETAVKEALKAEGRIEKEGFQVFGRSVPWMIARGQLLLNSENPITRALVPHLMGGLMDMSDRMLKKGMVRGRAADEIKTALERVELSKLLNADEVNYKKFRKEYIKQGLHKQDPFKFEHERLEFFRTKVTEYRRGLDMGVDDDGVLPGIKEMSKYLDGMYARWAERIRDPRAKYGGKGEAIAGMSDLPTNLGYTPRIWNGARITAAENKFGKKALNEWIYQSMLDEMHKLNKVLEKGAEKAPGMFTEAEIRKIADHMANKIKMTKIGGWHEVFDAAMGRADPRSLIAMLKSSDLDEELVEKVTNLVTVRTAGKSDGETAGARTMYRALLNERYRAHIQNPDTSQIHKVELGDFTENNATALASEYIRTMSGRVGLANVRIELPDLPDTVINSIRPDTGANVSYTIKGAKGKVIIDGIYSDQDIDLVKKLVAQARVESSLENPIVKSFSDEAILENYFQMMTNTYPEKTPRLLQFLKMMANFRYLGKAGFPAIGEAVNGIAYGGANVIRRLVSFRRLANGIAGIFKEGQYEAVTPLHRILRDSMGLGTDVQRMRNAAYHEDFNSNYMTSQGAGFPRLMMQSAFANMEKAQNAVFKWSGLSPATQYTTIRIAEALNDTILQQSFKYKAWNKLPRRLKERWAQNGLNEDLVNRAFKLFSDETKVKSSGKGWVQAVEDVDLSKLTPEDEATFEAVQAAIYRMSTRAIQENKWASLPPGFDHPAIKAAFQLRSFMMGSITQQLVNNSRGVARQLKRIAVEGAQGNFSMADGAGDAGMALIHEGGKIFPAMVAGAGMYVLMDLVANMGELGTEDFDKRLEYLLQPENLALAGISRSGFGSSLPFLFDTTAGQVFGSSFNGYRSSGQTEDIFGNPIMSTGKDIGRAFGGIRDFAEGEGDQRDWMAIGHMFSNLWITDAAWSAVGKHMLELEQGRIVRPKTRLGGLIELEGAETF